MLEPSHWIREYVTQVDRETTEHKQSDFPLQGHHHECDGVSNHQPHDCLVNRLFKVQIKENIKELRHWPLRGEFTGDRWIPLTKGQYRGKCFDLMTSSCNTSKVQKSHFAMLFTRQARSSIYGSEYIATRSRYCWTFITYSCYRDSFSGPSDCCSWHFLFVWHMVNHPSRACFLQYLDRLSLHYTDSKLFIVTTDHITSIRTKFHSDVIMVKSVYRATNALR